ncbi:YjaG family protein [Alteromonas sp. CYL-A6]|uniref:YjaG family protein n=1 Tax=Alteromonas nitratireducens TaxID=3390813 RepID=UPI0034B3941A
MADNKLNTFARVRALTGWQAVAFSAALLERMLPNYLLFCELTGFDDGKACRTCLDLIWESVKAPKSKINVAVQLDKVEEATPDTAEFDNFGVYPAIDAAIALAAALNLIKGDDPQGAVVVSKLSQGSVEAYLLHTGEATDDNVKQHPLMQFEVEVQQELLAIAEAGGARAEVASALKTAALEAGISNIGIELA